MKKVFLPIAGVIIFIVAVGILTRKAQTGSISLRPAPSATPISLNEIAIGDTKIVVELADSKEERTKGLSSRTSLPENQGMLFVFGEKNVFPTFWMKDTLIALDIIWINDDKVAQITKNIQPEPEKSDRELTRYNPDKPVDYVLEVNAGFSDKNNFNVGDSIGGLP